jgi:hypothetical protein
VALLVEAARQAHVVPSVDVAALDGTGGGVIERVHIVEDWARQAHQVVIIGRQYPGGPRCWLTAEGEWEPIPESATTPARAGFTFPEGALDALVAAHNGVTAPQPAIERHLDDAITVRDRLLALVEREAA